MPLQTLWWLHGHRNNSLPLKAEMTFEALPHCRLLTAQWASRSSLPAFLKHTRYVLPPGLCTCCFHHLEDSSSMVGCLTSFRFLCKIIFSEAFPWWPWLLPWVSGSEHRLLPPLSPTAWCLLDLIQVIRHVITTCYYALGHTEMLIKSHKHLLGHEHVTNC